MYIPRIMSKILQDIPSTYCWCSSSLKPQTTNIWRSIFGLSIFKLAKSSHANMKNSQKLRKIKHKNTIFLTLCLQSKAPIWSMSTVCTGFSTLFKAHNHPPKSETMPGRQSNANNHYKCKIKLFQSIIKDQSYTLFNVEFPIIFAVFSWEQDVKLETPNVIKIW